VAFGVFALSFVGLGLVGSGVGAEVIQAAFPGADVVVRENLFGRLMAGGYFGYFIFLWIYTGLGLERTRPLPQRVSGHP
jgi:ubiquinol-cytochrome c reductase cytochrome b subunit